MLKSSTLAGIVAAAVMGISQTAPAQTEAQKVPINEPTTVSGVEVACTGIGSKVRTDPRWKAFPVRVVFSQPGGALVTDVTMTVSDSSGAQVLAVACPAPWVLMKLQPGTYRMSAKKEAPGYAPVSATIRAPASGQTVVNAVFRRA